jgi:hypothetical protein
MFTANYSVSSTKKRQGDFENATVTYPNDVTDDVMIIDDMLREPGIPIGSWIDRSI